MRVKLGVVQAPMEEPAHPRKRPWFLTIVGLLTIAALVSMPYLAGEPGDNETPDWFRFVGHFHPVLLHLPIGVFLLIVFQEIGAVFRRGEPRGSGLFAVFFGAATAVAAMIAGFLLYHGHAGDYGGNEIAERHLWGGLVFAVLAVVAFLVKAWSVATGGTSAWFRLFLAGTVGVMMFASHDGATLTHGGDYLTKYAPDPLRRMLGLQAKEAREEANEVPADPVVYEDLVAPIFERVCVSCHKPGKAKGKLRMDTYDLLMEGGSEGPCIEPGSVEDSLLVELIELPEDDEFHMPPEGKPDIEAAELAVVKWWIETGADPAKRLSEFDVPAEVRAAIGELGSFAVPEQDDTESPDDELVRLVADLDEEFPGALTLESDDPPGVSFSTIPLRGNLDDDGFTKISPLLPYLTHVDLSASEVTDRSVALLVPAENLRLLRLAETRITDAAIDAIVKLPALESVNFYGTAVTDAGARKLAGLPGLKHLYLWQTEVGAETIQLLREKLPDCEIVTGP